MTRRWTGPARRADLYADARELLAQRETPEQIAVRLGVNADTLARAAYRDGHTDLARPFWAAAKRQQRQVAA